MPDADGFAARYLDEASEVLARLDRAAIERMASLLAAVRARRGRLFVLGVGGSAAHASHAVNDFRKLCGFEAYAPTDNVAELTARANDEGWETTFAAWLRGSRLQARDALLVFSVGGGDRERNVSPNLVAALELAREVGAAVLGIVGRDGGATARATDACVIVPTVESSRVTPHTEGTCAVVWHLLVSHPALQVAGTKWETTGPPQSGESMEEPAR
jgi:D-sedoheptulose 7-phosphate isomerase